MPCCQNKHGVRCSEEVVNVAVNYALRVVGKENLTLKKQEMEIVKLVAVDKRDTLAVLPTGFGKSLIYQILAPFSQFMDYGHEPAVDGCSTSVVLVISPLNALIRDQVTKLRSSGLKACILKADRVAFDDEDRDEVSVSSSAGEPLENLRNY